MNRLFSLILTIVLAGSATLGTASGAVFQNVVVNGTFTVASGQAGSGWSGTYSLRSTSPTLNGGGTFFSAGSVSSREVNQIYTLTGSEQALCKGAVGITEQGMRYFLSADLFGYIDQGDYARVIAEFRNVSGTVLASHTLDGRNGRPAVWPDVLTAGQSPCYQFGTGWAPAGTFSVRIRVIATRTLGDINHGFADNVRFELQPSNVLEGEAGEVVTIGGPGEQTRNGAIFKKVAAGELHSLALKGDGTVVAWGADSYGQSTVPAGLRGVVEIAASSNHSLALKGDGTVVAWGRNTYGQSTVPAGLGGVVEIAAGRYHSVALKSDGTVVAWGRNYEGQSTVPAGLGGVVAVAAGAYHSLALKNDGTVVAWGYNNYGQITVPAGLSGVVGIAAGRYHSLALKGDGTVMGWGGNRPESVVPAGLSGVAGIWAGDDHSVALKSDGEVISWGDNSYGQSAVPAGLSGAVEIAAGGFHSLALKGDGTLVAWGNNDYGQRTVPTGLSGVVEIAADDFHSLALKGDSTVVAWGLNSYGQCTVPAGLSGVVEIAPGGVHSLALKGDGTVVAWGNNGYGQSTVPAGLSGAVGVAAGEYHSLALKGDGTVVAWGHSLYGLPPDLSGVVSITAGRYHSLALKGDGTVATRGTSLYGVSTLPPGLSGVVAIAAGGYHSLALKGDGTVVAWGRNSEGQCTVPAGLSGVTAVSAGPNSSAARLLDGSWVTWGEVPSITGSEWWASHIISLALGPYDGIQVLRSVQPEPPHALYLAKGALWENRPSEWQDSLWTDDPNSGDTHTYELISGEGDDDNGLFTLTGQTLTPVGLIDYEQKSSYLLRARVTDSSGFSFEKAIVISVVNDDLEDEDNDGLTQRQEAALGTSDADPDMDNDGYLDGADAFPFDPAEWLDTDGDDIGNNVDPDDDNDSLVDSNDPNPLTTDFGPSAMQLTSTSVVENQAPVNVGEFSSTGSTNSGTLTYTLVAGEGGADNALFSIVGGELMLPAALDFEQAAQRSIRVRVTDAVGFFFEKSFTITVLDDDQEDADNDGLTQAQEAALGTTDLLADTDGDNFLDGADAFPLNSNEWLDTDGDTIGNNADADDDNDGAVDAIDAFPLNQQEMVDSDGDGVGNNSDADDDNDSIADAEDLTPEGTNPARLDLAFGTIGRVGFSIGSNDDLAEGMALQSDGRIVVAGAIWNGSNMDIGVARFLANGAPDTSFSGDGKVITPIGSSSDFGQCVAVQPDGKIVVAGHSYNGSNLDVAVVRYTAAGVLDTTFSGDGIFTLDIGGTDNRVNAIHILIDGKILLAGDTGQVGSGQFALLRLTSAGVTDTTFGSGTGRVLTAFGDGYVAGWAMAVQENGRIVLAGEANGDFALASYLTNGIPDLAFNGTGKLVTDVSGSGSNDSARAVAFHREDKIIVAGYTQTGNSTDVTLARCTPEGQLDAGFGVNGIVVTDAGSDNDAALGVAVRDDKILVAGRTSSAQDDDFLLMRFTAAGSLDPAFNGNGIAITKVGNGDEMALAMAMQPDGKIVMVGFSQNGSNYDFAMVRHMGDPPVPQIVLERSSGEALADGVSTLAFQQTVASYFSPVSQTITIRNIGIAPLSLLSFAVEGAGAPHFQVNTTSTLNSLGTNAFTSFGVTFSAPAAGSHGAVLRISSNDPDESPFEIQLSGTREALSFTTDSDGDGMNDASEFAMAALGFDWTMAQPDLVNTYYQSAPGVGFYRASQVRTLRSGPPKIARNPMTGKIRLTMDLKKSTDQSGVADFPAPAGSSLSVNPQGDLEFEFSAPDGAEFLRIELE